ncbi:DUF4923 family protein [Hallella bergensis]|uniref:DUF4923 family protein n=1 Tax=Hallella bergensis TaxID=242750 RepID=UPI0023F50006|nr:DUF4923 family protein [Hallella bergensis]
MNIKLFLAAGIVGMLATGCAGIGGGTMGGSPSSSTPSHTGNVLGEILGAVTNGEALGNVLNSVIGRDKLSQEELCGTWRYDGPGCAFTSESALAKAGGEVAATRIEEKLEPEYAKLGLNANNTFITFKQDGTFVSKIDGKRWSGNYTYDPQTSALTLRGLLFSLNGFATRNGFGISVLFESRKLLSLIQTIAAFSGNTTLNSIGEISKNYDGVRLGFDMKK